MRGFYNNLLVYLLYSLCTRIVKKLVVLNKTFMGVGIDKSTEHKGFGEQ